MKRLIALWNAYWFPTTSTLNLAATRIVAVAAEVFWLFPSLQGQIRLLTANPGFSYPQPLIRLVDAVFPHDLVFSPHGFTVIYWVSMVAGLAALVGFGHADVPLRADARYVVLREVTNTPTPISIIMKPIHHLSLSSPWPSRP